jgi:uncharacterized repeat protein (TIGR03803 family)
MKKQLLSVLVISVIIFTFYNVQAQVPTLWGMTSIGGPPSIQDGNVFKFKVDSVLVDLHDFGGNNDDTDGKFPGNSLVKAYNGLLYGLTEQGGANGAGLIFSVNPANDSEKTVYDMTIDGGDNAVGSLLQLSDSVLYGLTGYGGPDENGVIFSYNYTTNTYTELYSFDGGNDGENPGGSLIQVQDSLLYGTTINGGIYNGGTIFKYSLNTGKETVVYAFGNDTDGANPHGSLFLAPNGLLYGTTESGGSAERGTFFDFNMTTNTDTVLYDFIVDTMGGFPYGNVIQATNGLLYGLTGYGTIFNYNINTHTFRKIYDFEFASGSQPRGSLIQASDGLLYGLTSEGGSYTDGVLFSYDITDSTYTDIINFTGFDGYAPDGSLLEDDPAAGTGIKQLTVESGQLTVYPNPNNGQFTIQLNNNQIGYTLEIYDVMGEKIYQSVLSNSQNTINLNSQPEGIYFVYLKSGDGVEVAKVLVTK